MYLKASFTLTMNASQNKDNADAVLVVRAAAQQISA
jgi:hypothetical protein